jgi:hypothetical protein
MIRTIGRLLGVLRPAPRGMAGRLSRNDTDHLRSSQSNEARLNAAIEELNARRGTLTSMSEVAGRLREAAR